VSDRQVDEVERDLSALRAIVSALAQFENNKETGKSQFFVFPVCRSPETENNSRHFLNALAQLHAWLSTKTDSVLTVCLDMTYEGST